MLEKLQSEITGLLDVLADKASDPTGGITRLLYTPEWVDSQNELKKIMEEAGFSVYFDEAGNLFGRLRGSDPDAGTILTGSHVDTVRNGGKLDGMFGIIAGIAALRYLKKEYGTPKRSLEVVSFAEEEGSRFPFVFWGSKSFLGMAGEKDVAHLKDNDGILFSDAIRGAGFGFKNDGGVRDDIQKFIEIHIEQGNVLEREGLEIGVVNAIVGQRRFKVKVKGTANHAGTTPMEYRRDALYAASRMIASVTDRARAYGSPLVTTAGFIEVRPNIPNVVPGEAEFSLDIRHTDRDFLMSFTDEAIAVLRQIAGECGVEIEVNMWMDELPVPMSDELVGCLKNVCERKRVNYRVMHSGAGHDSQLIAKHVPTAMIFVPSKDGVSHNPAEYTDPEYLAKGVSVLIDALYELAY